MTQPSEMYAGLGELQAWFPNLEWRKRTDQPVFRGTSREGSSLLRVDVCMAPVVKADMVRPPRPGAIHTEQLFTECVQMLPDDFITWSGRVAAARWADWQSADLVIDVPHWRLNDVRTSNVSLRPVIHGFTVRTPTQFMQEAMDYVKGLHTSMLEALETAL